MTNPPTIALFHDYTDSAEYLVTNILRGRKLTRLTPQNTSKQYAQQIEKAFVVNGVTEFFFPHTWEAVSKANNDFYGKLFSLVEHLPIKLLSPLQDVTLETVVSKLRARKNFAGGCEHWSKDAPGEHCGMCLPCLHKYLVFKKLNKPTEEVFLEDPIDGFEGRVRLYNLMNKLSDKKQTLSRLEISTAGLISDCFMKDVFPKDLSDIMEKRFKHFLKIWGSE